MAVITATSLAGNGERTLGAPTTLSASDTFTYAQGSRMLLILLNTTAGALTPKLQSSVPDTVDAVGGGPVAYSAGRTLASIPATTGRQVVPLDSIPGYLLAGGTITITGGSGITAYLMGY